MNLRRARVLAIAVSHTAALAGGAAVAATHHVPVDYPTINAAIDAAVSGDTVLVSPGIYSDWEIRPIPGGEVHALVFAKSGVSLVGAAGPEVTILNIPDMGADGVALWASDLEQFYFAGFTVRTDILGHHGSLIRYSQEVTVENCHFVGIDPIAGAGSGIRSFDTNLTIRDCLFEECVGIVSAVYHLDGDFTMTGSSFRNNQGRAVHTATLAPLSTTTLISECEFLNTVPSIYGFGGGLNASARWVTVENCHVRGGEDDVTSLAMSVAAWGDAVVRGCTVVDNGPSEGTSIEATGTLSVLVENNTIHGAEITTGGPGAAIRTGTGTAIVRGNLITGCRGNTAISSQYSAGSGCNVFWDNEYGAGVELTPTDVVADPQYCDPATGDYHVRSNSPCPPEHSPEGCGSIGALGLGCGVLGVESKSWGRIKADYRESSEGRDER